METLKAIATRRSIREFSDRNITDGEVRKILTAGMSGPTCVNSRAWSFIVVRDKETLGKMADANGRPAEPLRQAAMGILICGDLERSFQPAPDYWVIDAAIATQNMILAAHDMGIGSVWLGTYPQKDRVQRQCELFGLPETIIPHSIVAFGYPVSSDLEERDLYEGNRVHFETW